ncbi:MAG TPA: DUF2252 domain-containing protein [Actinomycetota bacterium]|nr:DUF2252 domain-containing protein [Actinomycetota bacterium]
MGTATTTRPERRASPRPGHRTGGERAALGKAARTGSPRSSHGTWEPAADRPDPIALLEGQAATRLPELVPIRYGRMLATPFTFYRGAAVIMAADLAATPRSGITTQVCGDAHLSNFGLFGSPERELVFDINDFDETLPGPWEWDVKRLAASLSIAGRNNAFTDAERSDILLASLREYREAIWEFAGMRNLDVWYAHLQIKEGLPRVREALDKKNVKAAERIVEKAKTKDSLQAFSKLTRIVDGSPRIISDPPLLVPVDEILSPAEAERFLGSAHDLIRSYRRTLLGDRRRLLEDFRFTDMARKVVGVGSVGTRAWVILMMGKDQDDPLFLQAKEAQASVLEPYVGASRYANAGQRVVEGQRFMQAASDIFLGWQRTAGIDGVERDFYIRQLRDWKGSWAPESMVPSVMTLYGRMCCRTLARAHARSGDRIAIASYLGKSDVFDRAIAAFAELYADQNEKDHAALAKAVRSRKIKATTGV